jgi:DNA-binding transcriptional LysR family regulator
VNLNAFPIFAMVADASSFSEGARRLKMPVSTASRQIAELEEQLGVRLLERSTRRVRLTEIGLKILEQARAAVDLRENVLDLVSRELSGVSGLLSILTPPSLADTLIRPLVWAFQASHPNVRIYVTVSDKAADLAANDFDLVFKIGPMKDSALIARKIITVQDRLLASPAYLRNCKGPETPDELSVHRILAFSCPDPPIEWSFVHSNKQGEITLAIKPFLSVNDPTGLAEALLAGMGIGNLPSMIGDRLVEKGRLIELMLQWRFRTLDVSVVHAGSRHVRRPVQEFTSFAAKLAPALFPQRLGSGRANHSAEDAATFVSRPALPGGIGASGQLTLARQTAGRVAP